MKRLIISAFAAVALLAASTIVLWSHTTSAKPPAATAGMMSLQELHHAPAVNKLPNEVFEDLSLVYSRTR